MKYSKIFIFSILSLALNLSCKNQSREDEFWKWFSENQTRIYNFEQNQEQIFDELSSRLEKIDSNLTFEFSPIHDNKTREFTISADGLKESFPKVIGLVERAPKLKNWKINAFRQRRPEDYNEIQYGNNLKLSYKDIYFLYAKDSSKIGLELSVRNYTDNSDFNSAIYILLDGLIGEYDMETKIGWIEIKTLDENKIDSLYKIIELREIVDKLK